MNVKYGLSFWGGVFVALNLLSSVALADSAASAVPAIAVDPKKLAAQAENLAAQADKALDREELDTAIKLFHQAAELNNIHAQNQMGEFADSSQFYEEAVGWFLMAATQGDATGQFNLGRMYAAGNGIEKDESKALYWFRRSAAKDYLPAVQLIRDAYRSGALGVKIDPDQAKLWSAKFARLEAIAQKDFQDKENAMAATRKKLAEEKAAKAKANNK